MNRAEERGAFSEMALSWGARCAELATAIRRVQQLCHGGVESVAGGARRVVEHAERIVVDHVVNVMRLA